MPIYEYRCENCGEVSEILVGLSTADNELSCPKCGGKRMEKLMSAAWTPNSLSAREPGHTCCGREERCDKPPCSDGGSCHKHS